MRCFGVWGRRSSHLGRGIGARGVGLAKDGRAAGGPGFWRRRARVRRGRRGALLGKGAGLGLGGFGGGSLGFRADGRGWRGRRPGAQGRRRRGAALGFGMDAARGWGRWGFDWVVFSQCGASLCFRRGGEFVICATFDRPQDGSFFDRSGLESWPCIHSGLDPRSQPCSPSPRSRPPRRQPGLKPQAPNVPWSPCRAR